MQDICFIGLEMLFKRSFNSLYYTNISTLESKLSKIALSDSISCLFFPNY